MEKDKVKKYLKENKLAIYLILTLIFIMLGLPYWIEKKNDSKSAAITKITNNNADKHEISEGELVKGFPYFPIYPGAVVVGSKMEATIGDYEGHWEVEGKTPKEIMDWYAGIFKKDDDWEIIEPPPTNARSEMFTLVALDDKLYYLTIEKYPDSEETEIEVEIIPRSLRKDL